MRLFGLIGQTLSHSFSQRYFTAKFHSLNIDDARYELFPLKEISEYTNLLLREPGIRGLNVTIPYKEKIIPYLHEVDDEAKRVGAVNTIDFRNGISKGYNTDVYGFRQSVKPFLTSSHERALILGTGGASKAVAYVLNEIGIDCFFVTRDKNSFAGNNVLGWDELNEHVMRAFRLVVNTTPVGTFPDTEKFPPLPYSFAGSDHLFYDLVYNPEETMFMKKAREAGAAAMNGYDMLRLQAEKAWEIWNS